MKKKQRRLQKKSTKLKAGSLRRQIKQTNYYPESSRKKGRKIKSTKLEMKMEKSQQTTKKYNTKNHKRLLLVTIWQ